MLDIIVTLFQNERLYILLLMRILYIQFSTNCNVNNSTAKNSIMGFGVSSFRRNEFALTMVLLQDLCYLDIQLILISLSNTLSLRKHCIKRCSLHVYWSQSIDACSSSYEYRNCTLYIHIYVTQALTFCVLIYIYIYI